MPKIADSPENSLINLAQMQAQAGKNLLDLHEHQYAERLKKEVDRHQATIKKIAQDGAVLKMAIGETFGFNPTEPEIIPNKSSIPSDFEYPTMVKSQFNKFGFVKLSCTP